MTNTIHPRRILLFYPKLCIDFAKPYPFAYRTRNRTHLRNDLFVYLRSKHLFYIFLISLNFLLINTLPKPTIPLARSLSCSLVRLFFFFMATQPRSWCFQTLRNICHILLPTNSTGIQISSAVHSRQFICSKKILIFVTLVFPIIREL